MRWLFVAAALALALAFLSVRLPFPSQPTTTTPKMSVDPTSLSNTDQWKTQHIDLELTVDFAKKQLAGSVTHTLQRVGTAAEIVLDTRGLTVHSVAITGKEGYSVRSLHSGCLVGDADIIYVVCAVAVHAGRRTRCLWLGAAHPSG